LKVFKLWTYAIWLDCYYPPGIQQINYLAWFQGGGVQAANAHANHILCRFPFPQQKLKRVQLYFPRGLPQRLRKEDAVVLL